MANKKFKATKLLIVFALAFVFLLTMASNVLADDDDEEDYVEDNNLFHYTIEDIVYNRVPILDADFISDEAAGKPIEEGSILYIIRSVVAIWYVSLRNLSIVVLAVLLVYTGLRLATSVSIETRVVAKKRITGWLKSIVIVLCIHYFIILVFQLNSIIIETVSKLTTDEYTIYEIIKTRAYDFRLSIGFSGMIMYLALIILWIRFIWIYLKRYFNIMVLIIIAPVTSIKYALDSGNAKHSVVLSRWIKKFVTNVLLQALHALAYTVLMNIAIELAVESIWGFILALVFMHGILSFSNLFLKIFKFGDTEQGKELEEKFNFKKLQDTVGIATVLGYAKTISNPFVSIGNGIHDEVSRINRLARDRNGGDPTALDNIVEARNNIVDNMGDRVQGAKNKVYDLLGGSGNRNGNGSGNGTGVPKNEFQRIMQERKEKSNQEHHLKQLARKNTQMGKTAKKMLKLKKQEEQKRFKSKVKLTKDVITGVGATILAVPVMVSDFDVGVTMLTTAVAADLSMKDTLKEDTKEIKTEKKNVKEIEKVLKIVHETDNTLDNIEKEIGKITDKKEREKVINQIQSVAELNGNTKNILGAVNAYIDANGITVIDSVTAKEILNYIDHVIDPKGKMQHANKTEFINKVMRSINKSIKNNKPIDTQELSEDISKALVETNVDNKYVKIARDMNKVKDANKESMDILKNGKKSIDKSGSGRVVDEKKFIKDMKNKYKRP